MKKKQGAFNILKYILLISVIVIALFPVYWMINTSFKADTEIYLKNPTFFPKNFVTDAYYELFFETPFLRCIWNSTYVSVIVSALSIFFSMLASYSITRMHVKGSKIISKCVLYTYLMPRNLLFIPLFMLVSALGLSGSTESLILIYPTFTIPYAMWMMIAYFKTVPMELEEAALIDGCSRWQVMFKIFFPLTIPGIVSTFIFCFTMSWNDYLYALIMLTDSASKTFPLMLTSLMIDDVFAWGPLMAGSVLSCVPVLVLYSFSSTKITGGLTTGAVKS